jgi:hypothetical protein
MIILPSVFTAKRLSDILLTTNAINCKLERLRVIAAQRDALQAINASLEFRANWANVQGMIELFMIEERVLNAQIADMTEEVKERINNAGN